MTDKQIIRTLLERAETAYNAEESKTQSFLDYAAEYLQKQNVIVLPCDVGTPYYTIETYCTVGSDETIHVSEYDCACCECMDCDKRRKIDKHYFTTLAQIIDATPYIGKQIFLSYTDAEIYLEGV